MTCRAVRAAVPCLLWRGREYWLRFQLLLASTLDAKRHVKGFAEVAPQHRPCQRASFAEDTKEKYKSGGSADTAWASTRKWGITSFRLWLLNMPSSPSSYSSSCVCMFFFFGNVDHLRHPFSTETILLLPTMQQTRVG